MSVNEHWEVLGLRPGASQEEIKTAYRRLARANHPDRNPADPEAAQRFRKAAEAYRMLSSLDSAHESGQASVNETASDVFQDLFSVAARHKAKRGANTRFETSVSFMIAMRGGSITVSVPTQEPCAQCRATGAADGSGARQCGSCQGSGYVAQSRGFFRSPKTCKDCGGLGVLPTHPCSVCHGRGHIEELRQLTLTVPPGTKNGARLRVPNRGQVGVFGGDRGDLYIVLKVQNHPYIERVGAELWVTVPVPFATAVTGGVVPVPTIDGQSMVTITPGTTSGTVYRLQGCGVNGGDQYVRVEIEVPESVPEAVLSALSNYAELEKSSGVLRKTDRYLAQMEADFRS